jgi:ATP-binding cassette subfamily B multidrug efflux pump
MSVFNLFQRLADPTRQPPPAAPPSGTWAFYWHFLRQMRGLYATLFLTALVVALLDTLIPVFIGRVVQLMSDGDPTVGLWEARHELIVMALVVVVVRPAAAIIDSMVRNIAVAPAGNTMVRWQSHWHVIRQSWSFFQADFAGRVATRVMQVGHSLRETVVAGQRAVWHILIYGTGAMIVLATFDFRLMAPLAAWGLAYGLMLRWMVPRLHGWARKSSEARSSLMGRIVDSYTNILTVKLFARAEDQDRFVRDAMLHHLETMHGHNRVIVTFTAGLWLSNAVLLVAMCAVAMTLWRDGVVAVGAVATALALCIQIINTAGWVAMELAGIFENIGTVQEGMETIAVPHAMVDRPDAVPLVVSQGALRFEGVTFGYGQARGVLRGLDLAIAPGERVGLVGRSGAGKSTLVNLLLRFYALEGGRILIDGQDIAGVTQESLRAQIGMVTQDTSLLHRSIADNIRFGRPDATDAEVEAAADRAQAHDFIVALKDWRGRTGYDAHVGERGVKLSGGQRQRVALARVVVKDAPILVLDEATSALDSEVEAAIQSQLDGLMVGKTVIAIAHRLSTIARMDRLVVLDEGRVIEEGRHADLLAADGLYADLWRRQSGGFLADQAA